MFTPKIWRAYFADGLVQPPTILPFLPESWMVQWKMGPLKLKGNDLNIGDTTQWNHWTLIMGGRVKGIFWNMVYLYLPIEDPWMVIIFTYIYHPKSTKCRLIYPAIHGSVMGIFRKTHRSQGSVLDSGSSDRDDDFQWLNLRFGGLRKRMVSQPQKQRFLMGIQPWKMNLEHKNGDLVQMIFIFWYMI